MNRRVVVVVAGCVATCGLAGAGLVAFINRGPGMMTPTRSTSLAPDAPLDTSEARATQRSIDAATPWARISDEARTNEQYLAALNDPANSDLDPEVARRLSELGAQFLRADVSGEGRAGFGAYWDGGTDGVCCRDVVVHAAAAERHLGGVDVVDVAVIWSAECVGGGKVAETTTVVHFERRDDGWQPLHQWELP